MPTKPKKDHGLRITSQGQRKPQVLGRPPGTRLKRNFDETRLGFMLKYETPLEYSIITNSTQKSAFMKPDIAIIEAVCSASNNESFYKPKFKKYLDEYREYGIHCDRPKILTPAREKYYSDLRRNQVKNYTVGKRAELKNMIGKK